MELNLNVVQAMGILLQGATYVVAKKVGYILHTAGKERGSFPVKGWKRCNGLAGDETRIRKAVTCMGQNKGKMLPLSFK